MPPLPAPLAEVLAAETQRAPKRERTRRQLVAAAIRVFSARGVAAATIQEIAAAAEMAPGTVYNHFRAKDEVLQAVAAWAADALCRRMSESHAEVAQGSQRMAIGNRRYVWLAEQSPQWALLLLDIAAAAPQLVQQINEYALADLRLGIRQKSFRIASEAAALDLINGTVTQAMRRVALGMAPARHDVAVAAAVLRGLGMPFDEALEVARRPLPEFQPTASQTTPTRRIAAARRAARR
jgi:AcrR family transcriptional regulator